MVNPTIIDAQRRSALAPDLGTSEQIRAGLFAAMAVGWKPPQSAGRGRLNAAPTRGTVFSG